MFYRPGFTPPRGAPKATPQQKVLAQWRGADLTAREKERANTAQSMEAILPKVLKTLRIDRRQAEAEIVRVWNNLIDPTITAHAQPTGIHKGTVFVNIDSNVWLDEIVRYRRKEILDRLQNSFGKETIKRISFRVG
jgi:predicted nucleic acid-binding Zn ribbon protein